MQCMQQRRCKGLVDDLPQLVDVTAQAVAVWTIVAPECFLKRFPANDGGTFLHQNGQQFHCQRIEFERLVGTCYV